MKKGIFIAVIFFFSIQFSFAQFYHSFPDSNARWSEHDKTITPQPGGFPIGQFDEGWAYALGNDTIINAIKYCLVGKQSTFFFQLNGNNLVAIANYPINEPGVIFGAIREDSSRKIWFRNFNSNISELPFCTQLQVLPPDSEILLYDFDLHIGDSIPWAQPNSSFHSKIVISIDSILFNDGSYRKRYKLNTGGDGEYWIEGMGSTSGLFGAYMSPYNFSQNIYNCSLSCFWLNGVNVFNISQPVNQIECDSTLYHYGVGVNEIENAAFFIYPNPANENLFIQISKRNNSASVQVFNYTGQIVLENKNFKEENIDTKNLQNGFYVLKYSDGNNYSVKKFLVQH